MTLDASPLKTASPCPACLVLAVVLEHVIPHTKATLLWCSPHKNHSSYLPVSASLAKAIFLIFVLSSMWLLGYQETCGCLCLGTLPLASTLHEQSVHGLLADFTDLHLLDWLCACSQASQAVSLGHRFQQGCTWMDSMHSIAICPTFFFFKKADFYMVWHYSFWTVVSCCTSIFREVTEEGEEGSLSKH